MKYKWKRIKVGELGRIITGKTPATKESEFWGGKIPFITPKDLQGTKHIFITERYITDMGLDKVKGCKLPPESVSVSCIGNIGYVGITTQTCVSNQQINSIIPNEGYDINFIYYLMKDLWTFFKSYEGQSTTLSILNKTQFSKIDISVPDIVIQKRIAYFLSLFDDKIEINNNINKNLLQQARLLFERWMSKHNEYYQLYPLYQVAVINSDIYSPKYKWDHVNYLDTSSIKDGIISEIQNINILKNKLPSRARRIIHENDIVFSTVRPNQHHFGIINNPLNNMLVSTGFAVIRSNNKKVCNEVIYMCLTNDSFIDKMQQLAEQSTSTFPAIKPSDLGGCEIPCPVDQDLVDTLKVIFTTIFSKQSENRSLSAIRDALLPKLMSGDLDVSELDI